MLIEPISVFTPPTRNVRQIQEIIKIMVQSEIRFRFGRNWQKFESQLTEQQVAIARESMQRLLGKKDLTGIRFLDAGSGSGLFSLCACQLGATVTSFDLDPDSVACTQHLREHKYADELRWLVLEGSILDEHFLTRLGEFDVVYSWGVLHHTGRMWDGFNRLIPLVAENGVLAIAIYNDQGSASRIWSVTKSLYNRLPLILRLPYLLTIFLWGFLCRFTTTTIAVAVRLITLRNPVVPVSRWWLEERPRGMHRWYDHVDWVGGWPFEVARPCEVFSFFYDRGFDLVKLETTPGSGCNEYVFRRRPVRSVDS